MTDVDRFVPYELLPDGARLDHVAIGGPSLPAMVDQWLGLLGARFRFGEVEPRAGFACVTLGLDGGSNLELIAALPCSPFLDAFLGRTRGIGGLHHVTVVAPDVATATAALRIRGLDVVGERLEDPVWSEAFVRPRSLGGVLLQVATPGPHVADALSLDLDEVLAAAARPWHAPSGQNREDRR